MAAPVVDLGPEVCTSLEAATQREWLVTNGLGGYASGTVSGALTRRYHGLLVAALQPPGGRTLLVSKVDETLSYDSRLYELGVNRWSDGSVSPMGLQYLTRFHLQGTIPVWTFMCADAVVQKCVCMAEGENTTLLRYDLLRSTAGSVDLEIKVLVNYRDSHSTNRAGYWPAQSLPIEQGLRVQLSAPGLDALPFYLLSETAVAEKRHEWYRNFDLAEDRTRGLDDRDDNFFAGAFRGRLASGKPLVLVFSTDPGGLERSRQAIAAQMARDEKLLEYWVAANPDAALEAPPWLRQLVLAAAQFGVTRPHAGAGGAPIQAVTVAQAPANRSRPVIRANAGANTIIAGYPWFGEWSRDTMIALPGLTLSTGRIDLARSILRKAAASLDRGMLPNFFPESTFAAERPSGAPEQVSPPKDQAPAVNEAPAAREFNSADAALWYFEAVRHYYDSTSDKNLVGELYDALADILDWHVRGTRHGIVMDPADGLLRAGEPGVQLTWMDARVGDRLITSRIGKPIEVNALWYNALRTMARLSFELSKPGKKKYVEMAERTQAGFARFWNPQLEYCFDVLDGPDGPGKNDSSLRPNQIFAVALPESPLDAEQRRKVVEICARRLLTPMGLRTLSPDDLRYRGSYAGPPAHRDTAYHQGTAWARLLGPFIAAHLRVYNNPALTAEFLDPMAHGILREGLGTIGEISDGDPPFEPRGAIAQAWSVGEILRAWHLCYEAGIPARRMARRVATG